MSKLTLRLGRKLNLLLTRRAKESGRTRSDIARKAIRDHLVIAEFRAIRRELMPYAAAAGYLTDEDVFRDVS